MFHAAIFISFPHIFLHLWVEVHWRKAHGDVGDYLHLRSLRYGDGGLDVQCPVDDLCPQLVHLGIGVRQHVLGVQVVLRPLYVLHLGVQQGEGCDEPQCLQCLEGVVAHPSTVSGEALVVHSGEVAQVDFKAVGSDHLVPGHLHPVLAVADGAVVGGEDAGSGGYQQVLPVQGAVHVAGDLGYDQSRQVGVDAGDEGCGDDGAVVQGIVVVPLHGVVPRTGRLELLFLGLHVLLLVGVASAVARCHRLCLRQE